MLLCPRRRGRFVDAEKVNDETAIHGRGALQGCRSSVSPALGPWPYFVEGLVFVSAWFDENVERGYRLVKTHDRRLLDEWMANWNDLIDFEVSPVTTA